MKWLWNIGNLVLFAAALSHTSDGAAIFGRYSTGYVLGLAASAGLVLLAAFLSFSRPGQQWLNNTTIRFDAMMRRHGLKFVAALALLLLIPLVILFSLPTDIQYIELLLLFNILMLLVTLDSRPADTEAPAGTPIDRLLWVLLAAVLVVSFFSAHAVPIEQSSGDEAAWTNMAVMFSTTGQAYIRLSGFAEFPLAPGVGWWVAPYALWLNVFGVSLSAGRLFFWLFYLASVGCIGWAGARLYDRTTGLIAAVIAASSLFMLTFRIIRPEIGLPVFGALLLILYAASRKRPVWAFVAGWVAILSLEIHAAGLAYIVALILMFAADALAALLQRRNPFERRQFAAVAGLAWGSAVYVILHVLILPEPASYLDYLRSTRGFLEGGGILQNLSLSLTLIWERAPLEVLLAVIALAGLLIRRMPYDRLVLRFFAAVLVSYYVLVPDPHRYLVIFLPFMAWGIAAFLRFDLRVVSDPPRPVFGLLAVVAFSAPFFALSLPGLSLNPIPPSQLTPVIERARALSGPEDVVVGDAFAWWGLTDYANFYAYWAEFELSRGIGYTSAGEMWADLQPHLVFHVYRPGFPEMPPALRAYLDEQDFVLIDSFEWEGHPVEFYRRPASSE